MRHVFNGKEKSQIAHLFVHKKQSDARNGHGNFYFDGDTIYSYGSHFPIARHVTNKKGKPAILMTTRSYSSTTSKHIWMVERALHGTVIRVYDPSDSFTYESAHEKQFKAYYGEIQEAFEKSIRARLEGSIEQHRRNTFMWIERAKDFSKFFGAKIPKDLKKLIASIESPDAVELFKANLAIKAKRERKLNAERLAEIERQQAEQVKQFEEYVLPNIPQYLAEWRQTGEHRVIDTTGKVIVKFDLNWLEHTCKMFDAEYPDAFPKGDLLRIGKTSEGKTRIFTSRGSQVGVLCAKEAYLQLASEPKSICDYPVTEYAEDMIRIGCHTIYRAEIERFAKEQGW